MLPDQGAMALQVSVARQDQLHTQQLFQSLKLLGIVSPSPWPGNWKSLPRDLFIVSTRGIPRSVSNGNWSQAILEEGNTGEMAGSLISGHGEPNEQFHQSGPKRETATKIPTK